MSDSRAAWVDMPKFQMVLFVGHDPDWLEWKEEEGDGVKHYPEDLPPVRIQMREAGKKFPTTISLTGMTRPELDAFKEFMDLAFAAAQPVCERLDELALEAFTENGDDSFARIYRTIPTVLVRERVQQEHRAGLPVGPPRTLLGRSNTTSERVRGPALGDDTDGASGAIEAGSGTGSSDAPVGGLDDGDGDTDTQP